MKNNLKRFIDAQHIGYNTAYAEILNEKKETHWTWYIFPVQPGVSDTPNGNFYALQQGECEQYVQNKYLWNNYIAMCKNLVKAIEKSPAGIAGIMSDAAAKKIRISLQTFLINGNLQNEDERELLKKLADMAVRC